MLVVQMLCYMTKKTNFAIPINYTFSYPCTEENFLT